jgi:hypothetical protein
MFVAREPGRGLLARPARRAGQAQTNGATVNARKPRRTNQPGSAEMVCGPTIVPVTVVCTLRVDQICCSMSWS